MQASFVIARNVIPSLSYRVATRLKYLSLLRSAHEVALFVQPRAEDDCLLSISFRGILAHERCALIFERSQLASYALSARSIAPDGKIIE